MAAPKQFIIKESLSELKKLEKSSQYMIAKRIQALIIFKNHEKEGISKREVAQLIGVNHNSVQTWRKIYMDYGLTKLMSHSRTSNVKPCINAAQELILKKKLENPTNGIVGYTELLDWFNKNQKTDINYKTFHGFVVRKFNSKIKTARKSHIKKDVEAVALFKKTSVKSASTLSGIHTKTTIR